MVKLVKFVDRYTGPIFVLINKLFSFLFRGKNTKKRILVVKLWALGDSVLTLVLIKALKKFYPKAEISVLVRSRNKSIYEGINYIDNIYYIKDVWKMIRKYDLVFDCEPYLNISAIISRKIGKNTVGFSHGIRALLYDYKVKFNKKQHMVQNYLDMLRVLGHKFDTERLETLSAGDSKKVDKFLKENKIKKLAGITVGAAESATESRMWPIERYAIIADYLTRKGFDILFVGSPGEKKIIDKCRRLMKGNSYASYEHFGLEDTISLISRCKIFVSNDTGPMHIAAAQGVKTIGLFGANTPVLWGPYGKANISIYKKAKCSPCIDNTKGLMPKCNNNNKCIRAISVDDVEKAVDKILN